ncbi:histidine N-alpha-methyltransferase-like isoform X2 [Argopecten irradians]|uniref:histidine N-alpha-methyltransferase-like isoform X2 n=1 Tax=Argopecten irradians TaxID=31199 RepID=UPI003719A662
MKHVTICDHSFMKKILLGTIYIMIKIRRLTHYQLISREYRVVGLEDMDVKNELLSGLTSTPKYIPGWYRYDKEGSRLNDLCLQENENYYFHRCEMNILKANLKSMCSSDVKNSILVDMGSGNCEKTRLFIDHLLLNQEKLDFYPIDISQEFLLDTCRKLSAEYAGRLDIFPIAADYETGINKLSTCSQTKVILWFGSIQSLEAADQIRKLQMLKKTMTRDCQLIFSVDITQNRESVMKAYSDFHARQLYMNSIWRLIRDENCDVDPDNFEMEVDFIKNNSADTMSFVQVLIRAKQANSFTVPTMGITVALNVGEPLYLHEGPGISHKFTFQQIQTLIQKAGLKLADSWVDDEDHVVFCKCKVL